MPVRAGYRVRTNQQKVQSGPDSISAATLAESVFFADAFLKWELLFMLEPQTLAPLLVISSRTSHRRTAPFWNPRVFPVRTLDTPAAGGGAFALWSGRAHETQSARQEGR